MDSRTKKPTAQETFWLGAQSFLPIIPGMIPFGLVFGVAATDAGLSPLQGIMMSALMVAGAAQLVALELIKSDGAVWIMIISTMIVNLRFVIYSASLSQYLKPYPVWWRMLIGYFLTDQPYALSVAYYEENPTAPHKQWYILGNSLTLWVGWVISCAVGLIAGELIPESWGFSFAIPLMFLSIGVPAVKDRTFLITAIVSATVAVIAAPLPNNLGMIVAVASGMVVGIVLGEDE